MTACVIKPCEQGHTEFFKKIQQYSHILTSNVEFITLGLMKSCQNLAQSSCDNRVTPMLFSHNEIVSLF